MKKLLLTLTFLLALFIPGFAETASVTFSQLGYANGAAVTEVQVDDCITLTFSIGGNKQNAPKYYTTGSAVRMYPNNTLTVSGKSEAGSVSIKEIQFSCSGTSYNTANFTSDFGTINNDIWNSGDNIKDIVKFESLATSGHARIQSITVSYTIDAGGEDPEKIKPALSWSSDNVTLYSTDTFVAPTLTVDPVEASSLVEYTSSNQEVATIDASGQVTLAGFGTTEITAEIKANDTYTAARASYTIVYKKAATCVADALSSADNEVVYINFPLTVGYANGANIYAVDEAGDWMYIYQRGASFTFTNGDIITSQWEATKTPYNGITEFVPVNSVGEVTTGHDPLTFNKVPELKDEMVNSIVVLTDAALSSVPSGKNFNVEANGASIPVYNQFNIDLPIETGKYDITCIVTIYNNNIQIYPIAFELKQATLAKPAYQFEQNEYTVYLEDGDEIAIPALVDVPEGLEIQYSSSDEDKALAEDGIILLGDPGTVTITAYNDETDKYEAYETSFTLNILAEKPQTHDVTFDFTVENPYGMTTQTGNSSSNETSIKSITVEDVTITFPDGCKYRSWKATSAGVNSYELRINKGNQFTISCDNHYLIKAINITGTPKVSEQFDPGVSEYQYENNSTTTYKISTITVTLEKRAVVPEFDLDFEHKIHLEGEKEYNSFNATILIDDNNFGAHHYTIALDGKLIDNNVELEEGLAMVEVEYIPYSSTYDFTFNAIDAEGSVINSFNAQFDHVFSTLGYEAVDLDSKVYFDTDKAVNNTVWGQLQITYGSDADDQGYAYHFEPDVYDFNVYEMKGDVLYIDNYVSAPFDGQNLDLAGLTFIPVDVDVKTVFPMAHKEIKVIDETSSGAPRKVESQGDIVKTELKSEPVRLTTTATADNVTTGIEGVSVDNTDGPVEIISLSGIRMNSDNLVPGIYIRRQGTRTEKFIVR